MYIFQGPWRDISIPNLVFGRGVPTKRVFFRLSLPGDDLFSAGFLPCTDRDHFRRDLPSQTGKHPLRSVLFSFRSQTVILLRCTPPSPSAVLFLVGAVFDTKTRAERARTCTSENVIIRCGSPFFATLPRPRGWVRTSQVLRCTGRRTDTTEDGMNGPGWAHGPFSAFYVQSARMYRVANPDLQHTRPMQPADPRQPSRGRTTYSGLLTGLETAPFFLCIRIVYIFVRGQGYTEDARPEIWPLRTDLPRLACPESFRATRTGFGVPARSFVGPSQEGRLRAAVWDGIR
ncbi:hypothetical protein B0I37DRAFT_202503 [Chaetomium sp. MPI-CAGE-AT-0009]|nr:hypothetical protein B0I37DRAFT_202503 [Chaetomium sp. MPI-CAGE-AT-0009]